MKNEDRTAHDVLQDLIKKADEKYFFDTYLRSDRPSRPYPGSKYEERRKEENAEQVGKLVMSLPESDRKLLESMTSEELKEHPWLFHGVNRIRPKEPTRERHRGPISLGRSREKDDG